PLSSLSLMPEWYLLIPVLAALAGLGMLWHPLMLAVPFLALVVGMPLLQCSLRASQTTFPCAPPSALSALGMRSLTALLHLLQPLARLYGRLSSGLAPSRRRGPFALALPWAGAAILGLIALMIAAGIVEQCAAAMAALLGPVVVQEKAAKRAPDRTAESPRIAVERRVKRTTAADRKVVAVEEAFAD